MRSIHLNIQREHPIVANVPAAKLNTAQQTVEKGQPQTTAGAKNGILFQTVTYCVKKRRSERKMGSSMFCLPNSSVKINKSKSNDIQTLRVIQFRKKNGIDENAFCLPLENYPLFEFEDFETHFSIVGSANEIILRQ